MGYSFNSEQLPVPENTTRLEEGIRQGVHFTLPSREVEPTIAKVEAWFEDRDDVILVDHGTSEKQEMGFIILEWDGYEIDPLFLSILNHEDMIEDFTVYTHDMEE